MGEKSLASLLDVGPRCACPVTVRHAGWKITGAPGTFRTASKKQPARCGPFGRQTLGCTQGKRLEAAGHGGSAQGQTQPRSPASSPNHGPPRQPEQPAVESIRGPDCCGACTQGSLLPGLWWGTGRGQFLHAVSPELWTSHTRITNSHTAGLLGPRREGPKVGPKGLPASVSLGGSR